MTYAEQVDALLDRLPPEAYLERGQHVWAVCWLAKRGTYTYNFTEYVVKEGQSEKHKDRLIALQRAVARMENE